MEKVRTTSVVQSGMHKLRKRISCRFLWLWKAHIGYQTLIQQVLGFALVIRVLRDTTVLAGTHSIYLPMTVDCVWVFSWQHQPQWVPTRITLESECQFPAQAKLGPDTLKS